MWREHEPSPRLAAAARTPMRRQLLGLTPPYRGPDAELSVGRTINQLAARTIMPELLRQLLDEIRRRGGSQV